MDNSFITIAGFKNNMSKLKPFRTRSRQSIVRAIAAASIIFPLAAGCVQQRVIKNGPVITQDQLDLIPIGSSQEQVLLALGSPSSRGTFGNETFYYITQTRVRTYEFEKLKLADQKVLSVYFDQEGTVSRIANYGLQDGRIFDFITRTTPTSGKDFTFLRQILTGKASPSATAITGG